MEEAMGGACCTHEEENNPYAILVWIREQMSRKI
jgi:hypothetical protein